jgi:hypothetical protein
MPRGLLVLLVLAASALSGASVVWFWLDGLMKVRPEATRLALTYAPVAILLLAVIALILAWQARRQALVIGLCVLILLAGVTPRLVDFTAESLADRQAQSEDDSVVADFETDFAARTKDVAARSASREIYRPLAMLDLVDFAGTADLSYRSLPDHTAEAVALLKQALAAGLVDPNVRLDDPPVAKYAGAPLYLYVYDRDVKPLRARLIKARDWDLLQLLITNGADLTVPEAAELRADLAKTVVREGDWVRLE